MFRKASVLLLIAAAPAAAQTPTPTPAVFAHSVGVSLSRAFIPDEGNTFGFTVVGFYNLHLKSKGAGSEFSMQTVPVAMADGVVVLMPKGSTVWARQSATGNWSYFKIGGWMVGAVGDGGGGAVIGAHIGTGALIKAGAKTFVRLEIEPHFAIVAPTHPVLLFTIGISSLK
ncbi:MAG TPA: hypothetical protein VM100_11270 [Longimicrobiales bacterium]|nr:hypothetical protein [Longimicrobiales bacterium]